MGLTHFDENGKAVMVDVTDKKETAREAVAEGKILVNRDVFQAVKAGTVGKGDVLAVAATAGIAGEADLRSDSYVSYIAAYEL